ncbi:hypothetical protein HanOQP8_Chr09g0334011 [Helianthus annuus]|nr:hypothetical protein HanOQP8_Chr09g0334011 [Helianthus annuus]
MRILSNISRTQERSFSSNGWRPFVVSCKVDYCLNINQTSQLALCH